MSIEDYVNDKSYAIDGFYEDEEEIVLFIHSHNEKQKEIPEYINGKRVVI